MTLRVLVVESYTLDSGFRIVITAHKVSNLPLATLISNRTRLRVHSSLNRTGSKVQFSSTSSLLKSSVFFESYALKS